MDEPKLHWFQYSLRSLFLLTLLVGIGSYIAVTIQNQRKQKVAAEAIEKAGGDVAFEPTWFGRLLRDPSLVSVTSVTLRGESTTDDTLVHLEGLSQLRQLQFFSAKVTDAGLVQLQGLRQLRMLDLDNTEVTNAGLLHLQGLSQLKRLGLFSTKVSDAGLVHLQMLSRLQFLDLSGTEVTDAGLVHLRGLRQLQDLMLLNTKVTDQGIQRLQQALPNCKIVLVLPVRSQGEKRRCDGPANLDNRAEGARFPTE